MIRTFLLLVVGALGVAAQVRIGIIGTDTSHVPAFTKAMNDAQSPDRPARPRSQCLTHVTRDADGRGRVGEELGRCPALLRDVGARGEGDADGNARGGEGRDGDDERDANPRAQSARTSLHFGKQWQVTASCWHT